MSLRHLATGDSYRSLACIFRCGVTCISGMVPEAYMHQAILQAYKDEILKLPVTKIWKILANQF